MKSVWVDEEAREGAVFVGVPAVNFAPVQLDAHLVPYVQVEDDAVGRVVVILIRVLSDGAGPHLRQREENKVGPARTLASTKLAKKTNTHLNHLTAASCTLPPPKVTFANLLPLFHF